MRASSLSHDKVISLLNHSFVPVLARNTDYQESNTRRAEGEVGKVQTVAPEEKKEYERIYREALHAKLPAGTVHVYLLKPDGHVIDSMHVAEAAKPDRLLAMMERVVDKLHVSPGEPLFPPGPQSVPPKHNADSVVLHLTARYLERRGSDFVRIKPVLGTDRSSQWGFLPSEDWVVLQQDEWTKLLPPGEIHVGDSCEWDKEVTAKLLTHFYPPTENTDLTKNRLTQQLLQATVVRIQDGVIRARIEGHLKMTHPFYHKDTHEVVEARVVGFIEFEANKPKIRSLRLITDSASYGDKAKAMQSFGVAVRSVP